MGSIRYPKTLFIPDHVELAQNFLINSIDVNSNLPYCLFDIVSPDLNKAHTCFDWSDHTARVIDALLLSKAISKNIDIGPYYLTLKDELNKGFHSNGLHYTPENQWTSHQANLHYQRSVLNSLLSEILINNSSLALSQLKALLEGLKKISIKRNDFWYFPAVEYLSDGWFRGDWDILSYGVDPANTNGRLIFGLCLAHQILHDEISYELAKNYANHVMYHSSAFGEDGSFRTGMEFREGHFHSRAVTLLGIIKYGHTFNDEKAISWGKMVFDKALSYGTSFGWFPERIVKERALGCETCAVVDMMEAAIILSNSGYPQYWDIAESILKNQLVESQLKSLNEIKKARIGDKHTENANDEELLKLVGGFSGWSAPNDLISKKMHNWDLYLCCCAQGVRGLINAWTNVYKNEDSEISVNILINYADSKVIIKSWLPHIGKIEVSVNQTCKKLKIRIPSWIKSQNIKSNSNFIIEKSYLVIQQPKLGENYSILFDLPSITKEDFVLGETFKTKWKGNDVISIEPNGNFIPLYCGRDLLEIVPVIEREVIDINLNLLING